MGSRAARMMAAWVATAAMLFALAGPAVSGHAPVDPECAPAVAAPHDHAAHRLSAARDVAPDHCGACHLTRTARDAGRATVVVAVARIAGHCALTPPEPVRRLARRTDFTRGPPFSSLA